MLVSFFIIAYNAEEKIKTVLQDLTEQDYPHEEIEIILVDSQSTDQTKQVMQAFQQEQTSFYRVLVLDNPKKILPAGWNVALRECRGDVIVRVDAHCTIPSDFISANVKNFESGEKIVGGPRPSIIDAKSGWQRALLLAETSLFGSGIASYRHSEEKKYVSTLAHGAYAREVFETVGGYDERLARTEDNEMHFRMREAGYKLLFDPAVHSSHHARNSFSRMAKQKYGNGYWIGITTAVSPRCFSLYHYVPAAFVLSLIICAVAACLGFPWLLAALLGLYFAGAVGMTVLSARGKAFTPFFLLLPALFFALHTCYGWGTLVGFARLPFWKAKAENRDCPAKEEVRQALIRNHRK